jgi:hypothetical protein
MKSVALSFFTTLGSSLAGFGNVVDVEMLVAKGIAVVCLLLFFASLYQFLYASGAEA